MKFTYDYTQAEKNNPVGNNSLSSRSKFYQRSLYKEAVYPQDIVSPLDNWYDKNLYGRVNQQQDVILPRQQNLVQLDYGVAPNMYALNFVNRAFSHLVEHMHTAYLTNCIDRTGNPSLYNLRAVISYLDWNSAHITHRNKIIDAFIANYNPKFSAPIKNFVDFKSVFIPYLLNMSQQMPITRTSFILSPFATPYGSGLKIAIAQQDAGDDAIKYNDYINDPNFKFFARAAKKYGLLVDKYVPWSLTFDLFTDASKQYLEYYVRPDDSSLTESNFFETVYYESYTKDLDILQVFVRLGYEKFVTAKPIYEEEKTIFRPECNKNYDLEAKYRTGLGDSALSSKELIDLYLQLRYNEVAAQGPPLDKTRARAYEIYRFNSNLEISKEQTTRFIDKTYKNFIYPKNYSQMNLGLDITQLNDIVDTVAEVAVTVQNIGAFDITSPSNY